MNITFMIGNGFDLNCGMKSSYKDVYREYIKTSSSSYAIEQFKRRINADIETWADFEVAMASDMENYENEQEFISCLRDFKRYLDQYLFEEEEKIQSQFQNPYVYNALRNEMWRSIESFYDGISHDVSNEINRKLEHVSIHYQAISFNYTNIFETALASAIRVSSDKIIHIHGKLKDDVVLGMDNVEQLPKVRYPLSRSITRSFIKTAFNQEFDQIRVEDTKEMIRQSDIICIYGMSLGISDLTWRNMLFQWLHDTQDTSLFLYNYRCSCLSDMTADERLDNEEDAKIEILESFGARKEEINQYLPRLHIPCGKNIFNIAVAIQEGLNKQTEADARNEKKRALQVSSVAGMK